MLSAGTFINPILKIITTVAILAAVGFFIVKPILDTTEKISGDVNDQIRNASGQIEADISDSQLQSLRSQIASYISSVATSWPAAGREIRACARNAGENGIKLERCREYAVGIAHGTLSLYNFATSYADSLAAQGESAGAERVRSCVKEAGFKERQMQRCRDLADELLFG